MSHLIPIGGMGDNENPVFCFIIVAAGNFSTTTYVITGPCQELSCCIDGLRQFDCNHAGDEGAEKTLSVFENISILLQMLMTTYNRFIA
jgi:hypothetical protein